MRFKLDENIPPDFKEYLCEYSHDVHSVFDEGLNGALDGDIARACRLEKRIIITLDLDFSDTRIYPPSEFAGIIVLRPKRQSTKLFMSLLIAAVNALKDEPIDGRLWIVDHKEIRVRK